MKHIIITIIFFKYYNCTKKVRQKEGARAVCFKQDYHLNKREKNKQEKQKQTTTIQRKYGINILCHHANPAAAKSTFFPEMFTLFSILKPHIISTVFLCRLILILDS